MSNTVAAGLNFLFPILTSAKLETQDQLIQLDPCVEASLRELRSPHLYYKLTVLSIVARLAIHTSTAVSLREQTNPISTHFPSNLTFKVSAAVFFPHAIDLGTATPTTSSKLDKLNLCSCCLLLPMYISSPTAR